MAWKSATFRTCIDPSVLEAYTLPLENRVTFGEVTGIALGTNQHSARKVSLSAGMWRAGGAI